MYKRQTYPSADEAILGAEAAYAGLEAELQTYLDTYESTHDYDEDVYKRQIPYVAMHPDGVCKLPGGLYTKTVEYEDINYSVASTEDQTCLLYTSRCV